MGCGALLPLGDASDVVEQTMSKVRAFEAEPMAPEMVGGVGASKAPIRDTRGQPEDGHRAGCCLR